MPVNPNVLDPNKWVKPREKEKKQELWLSRVTVATDSGKQYDLDSQELNWIKNRYAQDNADSYGYDAADQQAKAAGQLSAKTLRSYTKSTVDQQLAQMGLPSQKNIDKYVGQFQQWNTGGIGKVFGNSLSSQDWSSIGNLYKQSWKYTDSAEDQMRKQKGLMPSALEANYTDTEVDDQLKAGGLPSFKDFNTYLGQYNNQRGIDALYANAAASYTAMRTRQDVNTNEYVKNDNKNYTLVVDPATGRTETKTGRDWYAQAFYDELGRTDKDGNLVYGDIMPLLKPSKTGEESYIDPTKSYIEQMDNLYKAKAKEDKVEFDGHSAFSYDDFANHYPEYYDAYIKDMPWDDNQTVDARLGVIAREADAQADKDFYDITDKWFDDDKGIVEFVERYQKDYPPPTPGKNGEPDYKAYYETMFSNMLAHGVSKSIVRKAMKEVRKGFQYDSTNERYEAVTDAYANANKAENKKAREEEQAKLWDYVNYDPNDPASVAAVSGKPVKEEKNELAVSEWEKLAKDYIKQAKDEDENDEDAVELARKAVENALAGFFDPDEGIGYTGTVDDVIKVINEIEAQNWNNPAAMRKALEDYGFSKYSSYSGLAADLTQNWSDDDKIDLALSLGDTKLIENADKSGEFDKGYKDIFGNAAVTGNENVHPYTKLDSADFNYALDWAKEQIADGNISEGKAYNILAGLGFQDELEHYIPKQWHEAHYRDVIVPKMFEESGGDVRAMWEGMTEEERAATAQKMVDELSDEQMAEIFSSPTWWKSNPTVYRTFGQAFEQQLAGMVPTFASGMIADAAVIADAIGAGITDRPAMKDSTNKLLEAQRFAQNYGSVYDGANGAEVSSFVTDAANEVMKMMVYGNIGGGIGSAIGGAVGGTAVGSALSKALSSTKALKWVPGFFSTMVNSTPFMASSFAGHYAEAKQMGATNAEAAKYGAVMGIGEGALEGANFDYLWGRALGANKFGEMLTKGAALFKESDVISAARVVNMAASFAGEMSEEGLGYFGETLWKMNSRWGRDSTEFSASDMLKEALMGGAIGLLGSAMNVGGINRHSILVDYWANHTSLPSDIVDVATGEKVFKGGTADERAAWENGDTHIMSAGEFAENLYQLDVLNKTEDAKKAQEEHKKRVDEANKKYNAVKAIETNLRAEANALDPSDPEYASKLADLNSKIRKAAQDSHDASLVREDEITKSENAMDARIEAESRQREAINKAMRDHWAGIYLQNETEVASRDYDAIRKNWARDRQNGATVTPESRAKAAEQRAAREAKLAEAEASETVAEAEQAAQTPEDAVTKARELAYNRVYKDQEAGKAYAEGRRGENDSKMTRVEFAENERKNFQAKTTARLRRVTLELAGLEANEGMSAKEIFAEAKKAMTPEAAQKLEIYQKLSKALGLNMVVRDVVAGTSGYVHDGKLYVTLNGKQSMLRVAAHELTHYMKGYASTQYDALRTSLVNEVGQEKFDEMLADKAQEYGLDLNDAKARLEADDEVCAELCERMLENPDALERFVQSDLDAAKTLKQRLGKTLVAIKSAIRTLNISADTKNDLIKEQETIEKWYKGLSDAIDAANNSAKAKAKPVTETVADTTTKAAPKETRIIDPWTGEEINLWSKSYKDWGYEGSSNSNYAVYLALKQVNPEMAKAYEDAGNGGSTDVLDAVINIANDVRQEQISPMAAATLLSNQYNADKTSLGSLFIQDSRNATQEAFQAAQEIDAQHEAAKPAAPETNSDLFMGEESARREQLRTELEELAKRGTRVNGLSYQEVNDVLDRVIFGDKSNYSKADLAQIRGMLAQLIPEVTAYVNGDASVDIDALNERVSAALDYMLDRYSEGSEDYYGLRDLIPNKIALTEAAYNELRSRDMTLREASNELRNALGGKFVSFVYKKSPDYNNAMTIDELWGRITDAYGEPDGYGNVSEDALALIDYVKDRNSTSSFDDLYGIQREDVVASQVGEFLDAVESMVEGKSAEQDNTVRFMADLENSTVPDEEKTFIDYTDNEKRAELRNQKHDQMVAEGKYVTITDEDMKAWERYFPDLRSKKKKERLPLLKEAQETYADDLRELLRRILVDSGYSVSLDASGDIYVARAYEAFANHAIPHYHYRPTQLDGALSSRVTDLIEASEYVFSSKNNVHSESSRRVDDMVKDWDYFYVPIKLPDASETGIIFAVRNFEGNREDAHQLYSATKTRKSSLAAAGAPVLEGPATTGKGSSATTNRVAGGEEIVNPSTEFSLDDDYMPLAEKYDAGVATDEETEELQADVLNAAKEAMPNTKIVDENGNPRVVYHGTSERFTVFDRTKGRSTMDIQGMFFSPWEIEAGGYGENVGSYYLNIENPAPESVAYSALRRFQGQNNAGAKAREYLASLGYDGVDNEYDEYIAFYPDQIKSADPVTYDDEGNIIPLSERFDPSKTDIRWAVDDDLNDLINQYGAIEQGREPRASDVRVPNQVNDATRVSRFGRSVMESRHMTNDMREEGKRLMLEQNWMSYGPKSDDKSMTEARGWIAERQPAQAQQEFHDMVMQGKFGSKTNAIGLQLLAEASERGDVDSFFSIATDLQMATTDAGRAVQILNVLKELKGVGSAYYMQRYVERLNNQYDDQIQSGKMQPITVAPELMDQLARAKTVDEINAAEDAVGKEIARQLTLTWKARLNNWRHLSMLGSPLTQFRNLAGNLTMMGKNAAKDIVAPAVQRVAEWTGRASEGDRTHAWLTPADKSYWEPFAEQSYKEQQRHLSGTDKFGVKSSTNQYMRMFDTKWLNALAKGSENGKNVLTKNGILGMLNVVDDMFIKPQYKAALKQYMKAQGYTLNAEGEAGKVNSKGEWTAMTKGEKAEAEEWATQQAWKATFHDASDLADTLNKLSNKGPGWNVFIEGVMPYKKTPINIAKRGFEYSPAGIVMGTVQLLTSVKKGKMSAAQAIDNIASGITGTALMTVGMFLAKAGLIRAGGEDKKKYEEYLEDTGDQKFALKFGDYSIDLSALSPASIPLFMGVALQERIDNGDWSSLELSDIADVFAGALNPFMEMSFMSSLNSALQNYSNGGIAGAVGGTVKTIAQNYVSQYLPTLGSKVAQALDPTRRSTKSSAASPLGGSMDYYVRSLMKKVPGVASMLQPDVDVWGRTDTKDSFGDWALDFANKFILPTQVRVSNRDAVDNELIRLVENTGSTDFLPSDGNKYFKRGDKTYNMTAKQYTEYSQDRGQASYAALKEVMQSAVYKSASDDEKAAMLEKALKAAQTQVNTKWKEILGVFDD